MRICDVVMNSIWYDPRVNRQIVSYQNAADVELCCVGFKCNRYDKEKVNAYPFPITIVEVPDKYRKKMRFVIGKLWRSYLTNRSVSLAIQAYHPDIIHANDLNALIPAMKAAKKLHCRVIYDSHEIFVENNNLTGKPLYKRYLKFIEGRLVRKIDKLVCVSHAASEYLAKTYHIDPPMVVTNSALTDTIIHEELPKNEGFEVLNHGQYYDGRGYDLMAEALPLIADYAEIRFAVRGFGKLEQQMRETVEACSNKEQFRFYPKVTVQELIPCAAAAHVGVAVTVPYCLNFKLSVSNKLFEYAAAGLPVILSDIPEHRYLNDKYDFGLIIPENTPKAIADAAIRLYQDHALYEKLSENAKKMSQEVTWEKEFSKVLDVERAFLK